MDKATLVGIDLEAGRDLLNLLDQAKFKVTAAAWIHLPEFSDWRLWIASPVYDSVVSPKEPVIRDLRRRFGKADWFVEGTRIGGHMIGDRFIEDGYVYKIKR